MRSAALALHKAAFERVLTTVQKSAPFIPERETKPWNKSMPS
jgi:hypothetical protein